MYALLNGCGKRHAHKTQAVQGVTWTWGFFSFTAYHIAGISHCHLM